MKVLNLIFIIIFLLSAILQYNDPDPLVWMSLYFYGAYICYTAIRKEFKLILYVIGLGVYFVYAAYLFFDVHGVWAWLQQYQAESIIQSMKAEKPWIEISREFFGLLILIFALSVNLLWLRNNNVLLTGKEIVSTEDT